MTPCGSYGIWDTPSPSVGRWAYLSEGAVNVAQEVFAQGMRGGRLSCSARRGLGCPVASGRTSPEFRAPASSPQAAGGQRRVAAGRRQSAQDQITGLAGLFEDIVVIKAFGETRSSANTSPAWMRTPSASNPHRPRPAPGVRWIWCGLSENRRRRFTTPRTFAQLVRRNPSSFPRPLPKSCGAGWQPAAGW
jgi:hypothetical protein